MSSGLAWGMGGAFTALVLFALTIAYYRRRDGG